MSPAQRLRALMRWRGIHSQNQLARLSGVPQSCIHRILTRDEHYAPSRATLLRLAKALDTSVPWLSDGVVSATESATPSAPFATLDGYCAEIGALLQSQPESIKKAVLSMVRLLAERPPPGA
ncbi:helix-turn-helix domain-containing protein [Achromobacter spanius]|uniref:helix-turn-helix domain-containing protein n=1 Tax=Achromobacter spanius TaxID=217203 RepID=UPI003A90F98C